MGNASNATFLSPEPASLLVPGAPPASRTGTVTLLSSGSNPVLEILDRPAGEPPRRVPMTDDGPGRVTGERRWRAEVFGLPPADLAWSFRFHLGGLSFNPPVGGAYTARVATLHVQDGVVYNYQPAAQLSAPRVIKVPGFSGRLPDRALYIYLPRGYDENTHRRYPVLYMHDGQNCFQAFVGDSSFGNTWRADETATRLRGCMQSPFRPAVGRVGLWEPTHEPFVGQAP